MIQMIQMYDINGKYSNVVQSSINLQLQNLHDKPTSQKIKTEIQNKSGVKTIKLS